MCLVNGCNEKYHGRGYCRQHYNAWKRHGDPLIKKKETKGHSLGMECIFVSCDLPVKCKGLCRMHYKQALSMAIRADNEQHDIIHAMQERIMRLEREVRCTHLYKNYKDYMMCVHCDQKKGF